MPVRKKENQINLVPQKGFGSSTGGRVLTWILSTFRIIVITTEIIVMIAFISRFWLDTKNSDLNEEISQKQAVLTATLPFEKEYKDILNRINIFSDYTLSEGLFSKILRTLTNNLPPDALLISVQLKNNLIDLSGSSTNEKSIQQYLANLQSSNIFKSVDLTETGLRVGNLQPLTFQVKAVVKEEAIK